MTSKEEDRGELRPSPFGGPSIATAAADNRYNMYTMLLIESTVTFLFGGILALPIYGTSDPYFLGVFIWNIVAGFLMLTEWLLLFFF